MPPETPAENPAFTEQLKAVQEALARESANVFARTSFDGLSKAIAGGKDAITAQLKTIQESPAYQSLSAATRTQLDALHATVGAVAAEVTSIPAQVAGVIGQGLNALPWYVKIPVIYGGIRLVESGARKAWKWITDTASSAKKMALIAGAGILAGIGIKSVYDGTQEGKPKTV